MKYKLDNEQYPVLDVERHNGDLGLFHHDARDHIIISINCIFINDTLYGKIPLVKTEWSIIETILSENTSLDIFKLPRNNSHFLAVCSFNPFIYLWHENGYILEIETKILENSVNFRLLNNNPDFNELVWENNFKN